MQVMCHKNVLLCYSMEDFYPNKNHGPDSGIGSDNGDKRLSTTEVSIFFLAQSKEVEGGRWFPAPSLPAFLFCLQASFILSGKPYFAHVTHYFL